MAWGYYGRYFPKSKPRQTKGGIKAQTKRGFGQSWWAKRWIEVLESFPIGARLQRGRSYARRGQVLSVDIEPGVVTAKVQGSRPQPYRVKIAVKTLDKGDQEKLAALLSSQALFAAKLLAGEIPPEIEPLCAAAGVSLFPERAGDLQTECSCPDWSNPCKHGAAVYYLLAEEFDRDPFLLFRLRGLDRERLVALLSAQEETQKETPQATAEPAAKPSRKRTKAVTAVEAPSAGEPLNADPSAFWNGGALPDAGASSAQMPPVNAALPKRLGHFPFWRGEQPFLEAMEPLYAAASRRALHLLANEALPQEERD